MSDNGVQRVIQRHLSVGWWCLLLFLTLGIVLEAMHGFKVAWFLNVGNESRRLLWRLAHAHGTFLGLLHIALAVTLHVRKLSGTPVKVASSCLMGATVLLPGGFFLGGAVIYGGDPGLGIFLLPVGALLLFVAVASVAWTVTRTKE